MVEDNILLGRISDFCDFWAQTRSITKHNVDSDFSLHLQI